MANFNDLFKDPAPEPEAALPEADLAPVYSDEELLALWQDIRRESLDDKRVHFERQWQRNLMYLLGRQWIEFQSRAGGWKDKRMAIWIPRPTSHKPKDTVQAIRSLFTAVKLGVNVRPNGTDPKNVSAATTADELAPLIHENHDMNTVMNEFDFWLCVTGNAFLHTFVDYDAKYGETVVTAEACVGCGEVYPSSDLAGSVPTCPECGGTQFEQAKDPLTGAPIEERKPKGQPVTIPLSPLEVAFSNSYSRFADLPYLVRLRWRTKRYFEQSAALAPLVNDISWQKAPQDKSLQLFKSLATHNDLGISPAYWAEGQGSLDQEDGIPEYEVWMRPCGKYPEGLVFRVYGDATPTIAHLEDSEGLPGPIPYADVEGNKLFPFSHATYEEVGGRLLGSGPLDVIVPKVDLLNQLDSHILLCFTRMANPVWLEPKGAEIEKLTGMPGLVIKWNPLTVGGNAKPERIAGLDIPSSAFKLREQYVQEIEEATGTMDIMKGVKPSGVEAFSALQFIDERAQRRFAPVLQARGGAYKDWFKVAIELEREFGPDSRTQATLTPARTWTFQSFKRAQLQGSFTIIVEDGSNVPKTSLGMRASVEHAAGLGMLNLQDPDQQYEALKLFGIQRIVPTLDIHVQAALQKQQAFEDWAANPEAQQDSMRLAEQDMAGYEQQLASVQPDPLTGEAAMPQAPSMLARTPLAWRPWYRAAVHRQEFEKWANSDRIREMLGGNPALEPLLAQHWTEMEGAMYQQASLAQMVANPAQAQMGQQTPSGQAMANSNRESTQGNQPAGTQEGKGPA